MHARRRGGEGGCWCGTASPDFQQFASAPITTSRRRGTWLAEGGLHVVEVWREELMDATLEIDSSLKASWCMNAGSQQPP